MRFCNAVFRLLDNISRLHKHRRRYVAMQNSHTAIGMEAMHNASVDHGTNYLAKQLSSLCCSSSCSHCYSTIHHHWKNQLHRLCQRTRCGDDWKHKIDINGRFERKKDAQDLWGALLNIKIEKRA